MTNYYIGLEVIALVNETWCQESQQGLEGEGLSLVPHQHFDVW